MGSLIIISPMCSDIKKTERIKNVMKDSLVGYDWSIIESIEEFEKTDLQNKKIIFSVSLGSSGINLELYKFLKHMRNNPECFLGSIGGVIVDGKSELYTKSIARKIVFSANSAGCTFPGRPLVEGTATLENFTIIAKNLETDNPGAYLASCKDLIKRVDEFSKPKIKKPNILVLHSGNATTSNTLSLWNIVKKQLDSTCDIKEISLRDGEIYDCRGCSYETCLHLGEKSRCFYGGVITKEVYPAIMKCDALVMICPNYNDAVSANLTAFINRLTAIFRVHRFFEKRLYAVIVSGYSGSDIVAEQLVSALNMNKTFMLPPYFALMETANDPKTVLNKDSALEKAADFGKKIIEELTTCNK